MKASGTRQRGSWFVRVLITLLAQAGEARPENDYLRKVRYAAKHSPADERTQRKVAARIANGGQGSS